jgi:hypothetical protein
VDTSVLEYQPVNGTASLASAPTAALRAGFHLHGQSSATFAKTPWRLELRGTDDDDYKYPLLGMPENSDWVMIGPFTDKALIRNAFMYDLARDLGEQAPRYKFFELYLNTDANPVAADDYQGVYLMVETIKNAKNRLNLKQLDEDDVTLPKISGGYIWKFDWMASEEPMLTCSGTDATCWHYLEVVDPDPLVAEQKAWLTQYLQGFQNVLNGSSFADPDTGYRGYVDTRSFIDQIILHELGRDMDAYVRSAYFYKDRDGKIFAGPIWDQDLTFGVGGFFNNTSISGWQYQQTRSPIATNWYTRMLQDPAFVNELKARWQELRRSGGVLSDAALTARVSSLT